MSQPIQVDLPHQLGKEEARRRIAGNIDKLEQHIPGGATKVETAWSGDTLRLGVHAMGQRVDAAIDVRDSLVHVEVLLPGMLAFFAGPIQAMLQKKGNVLLEDKRD